MICPSVVVATVRLLLVELAIYLYRDNKEVVAVCPLIVVVITPLLKAILDWLMRLAVVVTPLTMDVKVLTAELRELLLIKLAVVVETLPLTILLRVKELVVVETESILVDPLLIIDCKSVLVDTPLIVEVRVVPDWERILELIVLKLVLVVIPLTLEVRDIPLVVVEIERLLFEITEEVAITPLIVVVKVLPVRDWVKDEMNCLIPELTPLIIFSKKLLDVEAILVLIIFTLLELDPPILEESVLLDEVRVLEVLRFVTFRLVVVPELAVKVLREELPNTDWLPKIVDVVAVIVSVKRLEKYPVMLLNVLEKKLVEEEFMKLELVEERLLDVRLFVVRLLVNRLLRERSDPCILEMIVEVETSMLGMREERSIVAIEPPRLEVNMLPFNDNVLLVFRLVIVKLVDVPLVIVVLPIIALERLAVLELRLEIKAFVWVAFSELILVRLSNGRVLSSVLPLTVETILNPLVVVERARIFSLIIVEVEMIPFTLEIIVNVSPVLDIFNILFLIIVVVAIDPPRLESNSLRVFWERVLLVLRLVTFRLVVVPELAVKVLREELPNTDWLPKIVDVVAVIVSAKRLEKYPVMLLNVLEKKLVEEEFVVIRLVVVAFVAIKLFNVALFAVRLIVLVVVAVIVSAKRLEKYPVILLNVLEKKLVEEEFMKLELVEERLLDVRFCILAVLVLRLEIVALVIVALPNIGLSVNI